MTGTRKSRRNRKHDEFTCVHVDHVRVIRVADGLSVYIGVNFRIVRLLVDSVSLVREWVLLRLGI